MSTPHSAGKASGVSGCFCLFLLACSASAQVSITTDAAGLQSLTYGGKQYLKNGEFRVNAVTLTAHDGHAISGSIKGTNRFDAATKTLQKLYSWGSVTVAYAANGNKLDFTVTTHNTSPDAITGLSYEAMTLQTSSTPTEFARAYPILSTNIGNLTALRISTPEAALVLCNPDSTHPLLVGFPWALNPPANTIFPLRINTDRDPMYPNSLPVISRSIASGGSDTYKLSLRFGNANSSTQSLAADVYSAFAAAYPFRLAWPDRRPIGSLILATANAGYPTNPRGWLLDASIDIHTPAGRNVFRTKILQWADRAVAILKKMNAQGAITWDIEGEQYPHATTYIGDPTQLETFAPEMATVADEYFKKFTEAGLRVGVCIRPQQVKRSEDGASAEQTDVEDPTKLLIQKIQYAKNRWGATLFYMDSNGDPSNPLRAEIVRAVVAAVPGILLMPEHQNLAYYSITAPYDQLNQGIARTPQSILDVYPQAFTLINTQDGGIVQNRSNLQSAVEHGDILMFRGWYDDQPANGLVKLLSAPAKH